jgi:hypothetical protein
MSCKTKFRQVHATRLPKPGRDFEACTSLLARAICEKRPTDADTNLLDVYRSKLGTKLEVPLGEPLFKTPRGVGYKLPIRSPESCCRFGSRRSPDAVT